MKKYKVTLSDEHCEGVERIIEHLIQGSVIGITNQVTISVLSEVLVIIKRKRAEYKRNYKFSFTPAQALSLCCLYYSPDNVMDFGNDFINRMHQLNNEVLQKYSI